MLRKFNKLSCTLLFIIFPALLMAQVKITNGYIELKESPASGKKMGKIAMVFDDDLKKMKQYLLRTKLVFPIINYSFTSAV